MKLTMIPGQSERTLSTLLLLAMFSLTAQTSFSQQATSAKLRAATTQTQTSEKSVGEEEEPAVPSKPGREGIRIHGHWVIDVKNPDGTIAQHRDFENSLVAGPGLGMLSGDQILAALLSGTAAPGGMGIGLVSGPVATPGYDRSQFCNSDFSEGPSGVPAGIKCFGLIAEGTVFVKGRVPLSGGQTVLQSTVTFDPSVAIVLSGNFVLKSYYAMTSIDAVQTYVALCTATPSIFPGTSSRLPGTPRNFDPTSIPAADCSGTGGAALLSIRSGAFTSTNLAAPLINLVVDQVISVKVTLSFS